MAHNFDRLSTFDLQHRTHHIRIGHIDLSCLLSNCAVAGTFDGDNLDIDAQLVIEARLLGHKDRQRVQDR